MKTKRSKRAIVLLLVAFLLASCPFISVYRTISMETANAALEYEAALVASGILKSVLNDIPFIALKEGNPASLDVSESVQTAKFARYDGNWAKSKAVQLFGTSSAEENGQGYPCMGEVTNASGTRYLVRLKAEDVFVSSPADAVGQINIGKNYPESSPNEFPKNQKLTFAFIKNPALLSNGTWMQFYAIKKEENGKPFLETELPNGVSMSPINIYESDDYINPVAERKYPKFGDNASKCMLKKLTLQVQYKDAFGEIANYHLITVKGDLD